MPVERTFGTIYMYLKLFDRSFLLYLAAQFRYGAGGALGGSEGAIYRIKISLATRFRDFTKCESGAAKAIDQR